MLGSASSRYQCQWPRSSLVIALLAIATAEPAFAQYGRGGPFSPYGFLPYGQGVALAAALAALAVGAAIGGFVGLWLRFLASPNAARTIIIGLAVVSAGLVFLGETTTDPAVMTTAMTIAPILAFFVGFALFYALFSPPPVRYPSAFGSSRWADAADLAQHRLIGQYGDGTGLFLGRVRGPNDVVYAGDMHALTVAPTRAGKGATAIIPNLLVSTSSILVIDPKGENARRTAARRQAMGQKVVIIDPWKISSEADRHGAGADPSLIGRYNPLDALDPASPDLATDAMMLADALVIPSGGDNRFWDEEAKGLIFGLILYLVTDDRERALNQVTLGRLRQLLTLAQGPSQDPDDFTFAELSVRMGASANELVRTSGARFFGKEDRERSGVLSSAQSNTHFLDSPVLRDNLSRSDIQFGELKTGAQPVTVYLVLPLDRLSTFNRWLRLVVISALKDLMRIPHPEGKPPVRLILDEFAALKRLDMIKEAYGTMAGLGVQLWAITQDLGQLKELYGESWQTFVGNAGVFQYFGSRDHMTAQYASQLTGITTVRKRATSATSSRSTGANGGGSYTSGEGVSHDDAQRPLAYPDELMTLPRDREILFVENCYPIIARKVGWFDDPVMQALQEGGEGKARRR